MSDQEDITNPKESVSAYELQKRDAINRRGREFSHSVGDTCEQKTGVFEWELDKDLSRFSLGVCNMIGVEQSHTVRGLFSIFQYVPAEEWQKVRMHLHKPCRTSLPWI